MQKLLIAIDPGKSGGIALLYPDGKMTTVPMPESETALNEFIGSTICNPDVDFIYVAIEKVGGFTGKGQPGSAMFTFGRGVGVIVGMLIARGIGFVEIPPQTWMKHVGAGTKKSTSLAGSKWKRHLVDLAKKRHPANSKEITLKTADAILLLDWLKAQPV